MVEFDVQMYATAMQELQTKIIELEAQRHLIDLMDQFVRNPENKYKLVPSLYTPSTDGGGEGPSGGALSSYNQTLVEKQQNQIILDLKKFNSLDLVIKKRVVLYTINSLFGNTCNIEKIHIEDIIKLCANNIGNKFLTPNKNIKVLVKNQKIFFVVNAE